MMRLQIYEIYTIVGYKTKIIFYLIKIIWLKY